MSSRGDIIHTITSFTASQFMDWCTPYCIAPLLQHFQSHYEKISVSCPNQLYIKVYLIVHLRLTSNITPLDLFAPSIECTRLHILIENAMHAFKTPSGLDITPRPEFVDWIALAIHNVILLWIHSHQQLMTVFP